MYLECKELVHEEGTLVEKIRYVNLIDQTIVYPSPENTHFVEGCKYAGNIRESFNDIQQEILDNATSST
jgi:hypothetical protein